MAGRGVQHYKHVVRALEKFIAKMAAKSPQHLLGAAYVVDALWCHYDDCTDHKVVLSKPAWDYFHRLMLLVKSDAEVQFASTTRKFWRKFLKLLETKKKIFAASSAIFWRRLNMVSRRTGESPRGLTGWL